MTNPSKYHNTLQNAVLDHFETVSHIVDALPPQQIVIVERSVYSTEFIFTRCGVEDQTISGLQLKNLNQRFYKLPRKPHIHIWINTQPSVCF